MKKDFLNEMKLVLVIVTLFVFGSATNSCGGGGSSGGSTTGDDNDPSTSVTVAVSPLDSATGISRLTSISATFSAAITDPLSWYNLIKLQKNGTGNTLCTAVSYDSATKTVTCGHDTLDENASYTLTIAGVKDSSGACVADSSTTFTTSGTTPVESVEKTTMTTTAGGTVNVTFNFSTAISSSITPSVSVTSTDTSVEAGTCAMDGTRESCAVAISGVAGCDMPTDYWVTLSMTGYEDYETNFNSADNEFEVPGTVSANDCWETDSSSNPEGAPPEDYSWTATGGNLKLAVSNTDATHERDIYYDHVISDDREGAFAVHVDNLDTLSTTGAVIDLILVQATNSDFDGLNGVMSGYNGVAATTYTGWLSVYQEALGDDYLFGIPTSSGDLGDTENVFEDYYICQTAYNDVLTTYISLDGENYIKISEDDMACANGGASCDLDQIDSRSIASWSDLRLSLQVGSTGADGSFYAEFGFARFRTSNLNGSMADCPRMTR